MKGRFAFLQYCIDPSKELPDSAKSIDWKDMIAWAEKQAIVGVIYGGIEKAGKALNVPFNDLMEWLGCVQQIAAQNKLLNDECIRLTQLFESEGHKTAILKGQANARLYPNPLSRQPGDIDIYVDGGEKKVLGTLYRLGMIGDVNLGEYEGEGNASKQYHHVHLPTNSQGVDVEVHFRPSSGVWNPFANRRIQRFLEEEIEKGCELVEDGFRVPSIRFALVMQMAHMQKHFMGHGLGLRQIIDYYFDLKNTNRTNNTNLKDTLRYLGLEKFAGAVMYVMKDVLGLDENLLIVPADERRGKILLNDILRGGNFGQYSVERRQNGLGRLFLGRLRHLRLLCFDYKETIWYELRYWKVQAYKTLLRMKRRSWTVK